MRPMEESKHSQHRHGPDHDRLHHAPRPYWKRAHRDWRLWIAVFIMLVAMVIYVMSDDLSFQPGRHPQQQQQQPASGAVAQ